MLREILPDQLFLGHARDARDLRLLHDHQIAAVLDLAIDEPPAQLAREMISCRIPLVDGGENPPEKIVLAIRTLELLLENHQRVLVACSGGMSRSPVFCAAALALRTKRSLDDCLTQVLTDGPGDVSPPLWESVQRVVRGLGAS